MKKSKVLFIVLSVICICITICSIIFGCYLFKNSELIFDNDRKVSDYFFENLTEAIETENKEQLISLLSKNTVKEVDTIFEDIDELFEYFDGDIESYVDWLGGPYVETSKEGDNVLQEMQSTYDIKTSKGNYRLAISYVTKDTKNADNIGIHSLYVIKLEDDDKSEFAYWGDSKFTLGIHIGVKNI